LQPGALVHAVSRNTFVGIRLYQLILHHVTPGRNLGALGIEADAFISLAWGRDADIGDGLWGAGGAGLATHTAFLPE